MARNFGQLWLSLAVAILAAMMLVPASSVAETDDDSESSAGDMPGDQLLPEQQSPDDMPTVSTGDFRSGLDEAGELLEDNFSHFLERQPLGFSTELLDDIADDIDSVYQTARQFAEAPTTVDPAPLLSATVILIVLASFLVLFLFIDRYATGMAHRIQARTHFDISPWITTTLRKLVLVMGRSVAWIVLIGLSYFPTRAVFGAASWPLLLTDALFFLLVYRVLKTLLLAVLRLHPRSPEAAAHFQRLERFGVLLLRITLVFFLVIATVERLEYHAQLAAFVSFGFRATLALIPLYLVVRRDTVLSLFPPQPQSRLHRSFQSALSRNYYALSTLTFILLLFNAAGYIHAATYLLTRGYALIIIGAVWFAILERLHHHVVERARKAEENDETASPLLEALEQWIVVIGSLVIVITTLQLLGLFGPLVAVLQAPLVSIGHLQVSLLNLFNVVLIIGGAYLTVRLFKAILNAKIYPAMGIDIGVAYAINTLINYALVVVAFILCLVALGVQLSAVMVVIASLGVGIGFGLQNIAENLISGFILLFGRAVQKGDFITVNDLYGRVEAVGARSVVMRTPDNFSMLVPSKEIVSGRIVNWTFQDSIVRIHIPVGVSYDSDAEEVRQVLLETADDHPDILDEPEPDVWITEFADSSIQFELLVYFDCRQTNENALKGKFNFLIWEALTASDIEIPYPQRDLHLRSRADVDSDGGDER